MKKIESYIIVIAIILIIMLAFIIILLNNRTRELQNSILYNNTATQNTKNPNAKNNVTIQLVSNEEMCKTYYKDYKQMLLNSPKEAYDLLDPEYKAKRFPQYEQFAKFVKENEDYYRMNDMREYNRTNYDGYYQYTVIDICNGIFVFKETAVQEYTVQLDDYTLENKIFNEAYKKASVLDKCLLNCEKFIQMINTQDYTSAYNLLNSNFKNTNFKTQADFEKYIKDKFPKHCKAIYNKYRKPVDGINIIETRFVDVTMQTVKTAEMNIVMALKDGTDFEISFEKLD